MQRVLVAALLMFLCGGCAVGSPATPHVPDGFSIERIATVEGARELAVAPNGDLFIGTDGDTVVIVQRAQSAHPASPHPFAELGDSPAAGVALAPDALFVGTQFGIYRIAYRTGDSHATSPAQKLASVRTSGEARDHETTSLAWNGETLYASIGSSCNACRPDLDPTRATIQRVDIARHSLVPVAVNIRNAIALAVNPRSHALWAGVAGVDDLQPGEPYEIFDDVTAHRIPVNYGWPSCYDDRRVHPKWPADCSHVAIPRVIFPAYATPIGVVFYAAPAHARYAFPSHYEGGAFVTLHGSWHDNGGFVPPRVAFVPMNGDEPQRPMRWNDPQAQWSEFVGGFQEGTSSTRIGRPTGIAVGPDGLLFVADDLAGAIYRIRPR